jgi:hypothetical protein
MTSILLPLYFQELAGLEKRQCSYIEQAVELTIEKDARLIISIDCEEIRANAECLDAIWERVQAFLGTVYVIQLNKSYELKKPMFECNVVFKDICGYTIHLEPYITTVCTPELGKVRQFFSRSSSAVYLHPVHNNRFK